jgi:outer membrane protein TolC
LGVEPTSSVPRFARQDPPATSADSDDPKPIETDAISTERPVDLPKPSPTILSPSVQPIDLNTALRLAGVQNPQLLIARQRIVEAAALRQLAAAQILPSINLGTSYDAHNGPLQQSNGNILSLNRSSVYVGAGASAIAAGSVNIPGVLLTGNIAVGVYGYLTARQIERQREFASVAVRNQAFLRTALTYCALLRAEGTRAIALQVRDDARQVAKLTGSYAAAGQGRRADANRAATELAKREADFQGAEGAVLTASARLCEVINIDPSIRLHPTDAWVVPAPIVPDPIPVNELIALALLQRPELGERRAAVREALLALDGAKVLPFSPTVWLGFSAGGFGGGSNLVHPVFGSFGGRNDLDVYAYWTLQNFGVGNASLINLARSRAGLSRYQEVAVLDRIRAEVAEAYAQTHARFAQIGTTEAAVRTGTDGFREDFLRVKNTVGLPIELLDSMRLLARSRYEYLDAIVDYNEAQFSLYVALGQPPADTLARPVPTAGVASPGQSAPNSRHPGVSRPATDAQPAPPPIPRPGEIRASRPAVVR